MMGAKSAQSISDAEKSLKLRGEGGRARARAANHFKAAAMALLTGDTRTKAFRNLRLFCSLCFLLRFNIKIRIKLCRVITGPRLTYSLALVMTTSAYDYLRPGLIFTLQTKPNVLREGVGLLE